MVSMTTLEITNDHSELTNYKRCTISLTQELLIVVLYHSSPTSVAQNYIYLTSSFACSLVLPYADTFHFDNLKHIVYTD